MIDQLFVSKVRVKLLKFFFLDTSKELHIRGITRKIDEEINAVRRELKNLESASILRKERRGNRLYYKINKDCPIYYELLGLVNKEFGLGRTILDNKDHLGEVRYAVLTTAYLENHHPSPYDVDILIIGNLEMKNISSAIKSAESSIGREIRYTVMTEEEFDFRKKKRDSFISNILNRQKIILIGDENELMS
ncbi:hypothetical protein JW710_02940 [Candidatus Dojkabacteria bacterium]|nr:hypothetical protein [Candidatus Dojkabacteria bacterium]